MRAPPLAAALAVALAVAVAAAVAAGVLSLAALPFARLVDAGTPTWTEVAPDLYRWALTAALAAPWGAPIPATGGARGRRSITGRLPPIEAAGPCRRLAPLFPSPRPATALSAARPHPRPTTPVPTPQRFDLWWRPLPLPGALVPAAAWLARERRPGGGDGWVLIDAGPPNRPWQRYADELLAAVRAMVPDGQLLAVLREQQSGHRPRAPRPLPCLRDAGRARPASRRRAAEKRARARGARSGTPPGPSACRAAPSGDAACASLGESCASPPRSGRARRARDRAPSSPLLRRGAPAARRRSDPHARGPRGRAAGAGGGVPRDPRGGSRAGGERAPDR